ncbi:MAG: LamG domain-containing protein [Gammaproteobacteria bacterium]|nr:LamG domain-containing protein [Gammaproteobacteria bacterium]
MINPASIVTDGYDFGNSIQYDGVNDRCSGSSAGTWNPYQTDWSISIWAKGVGGNMANGSWIEAHRSNGSSGCFFGIHSNTTMRVMSNFREHIFTYVPTALFMQEWHHFGISVENIDASNQQALLYVDGLLVETGNFSNAAHSTVTSKLRLGGESGAGGQKYNGIQNQVVLTENLISAAEFLALCNGGVGADPIATLSGTIKNYYSVSDSIGKTTGDITDMMGNQNLTMTNFLSPYGVIADKP